MTDREATDSNKGPVSKATSYSSVSLSNIKDHCCSAMSRGEEEEVSVTPVTGYYMRDAADSSIAVLGQRQTKDDYTNKALPSCSEHSIHGNMSRKYTSYIIRH